MISVIIPNYNGKEHLQICLASLEKQSFKKFRTIVVDNGSTDSSVDFVKTQYPEIDVIALKENAGFAKAINLGIKKALINNSVKHILLLNNDIECDSNFVFELLNGFTTGEIGSVACKMLNYYNRNVIDDTGDFIKVKGFPYPRGQGKLDEGQYDNPENIFGPCAGAAIYKREVFENVGFFDEDFFAYYEDVDLSFRMQLQGFKCYYNPKAVCFHKRGATTFKKSYLHVYLIEKNLVSLRLKNYPSKLLFKFSFYFQFSRIKRYLSYWRNNSFKYFFSALKGYFDGMLGIYSNLKKRKIIQRDKKVTKSYIYSILEF